MTDAGTDSPELLLRIDRSDSMGLRQQVETRLREAIREGRLAADTRLPSSRALAADIGVTRRTVQDAYEQLVAEGYLSARVGAGTTVNEMGPPPERPPTTQGPADVRFDLRAAFPDLRLFPWTQWAKASASALATMSDDQLDYLDHRGLDSLRTQLAQYLARVRGLATARVDVMVCSGFGHGLGSALAVLAEDGVDDVAVEDPGYDGAREIISHLGLRITPIPVDADGIRVDLLARTRAQAVVVSPAHQAPMGVVLSPARRGELVAWAHDRGGWIIEDDYDAEFRYDRAPIGAVQGLCPNQTVYIGTLAKCLAPGLRLGWTVAAFDLTKRMAARRRVIDGTTSTVLQATLAEFIDRGDLDRHIRRSRQEYQRRRDALVAALRDTIPGVQLGEVAAGLHVPMRLPAGVEEDAVVSAARDRGVLVDSLATFRVEDETTPPTLVVGFGRVRQREAPAAAEALADAVAHAATAGVTRESA